MISLQDPPRYFAERLKDTMQGIGTEDLNLIRIMVEHYCWDLRAIAEEFFKV